MPAELLTPHCLFWCFTNLIIVLDLECLLGHSCMIIIIAVIELQFSVGSDVHGLMSSRSLRIYSHISTFF